MTRKIAGRVIARLRLLAARLSGRTTIQRFGLPDHARTRILYVANSFIPTLQLSFIKPLQQLVDSGDIAAELLSEQQLKEIFGKDLRGEKAAAWVRSRMEVFRPDFIVFCRYSGPHAPVAVDWAREHGAATIFHIDDDLLHVPPEIGKAKFAFHNHPIRIETVEYLLRSTALVYCSTPKLLSRLQGYGFAGQGIAGDVYCSSEILGPPPEDGILKIGYMGFDHAHDFELALPALVRILDQNPGVHFELFGSIPKPAVLDRFGARVVTLAPVAGYDAFMAKFASLGWAVGICPLANTEFNSVKANTKWVEYTAIGAAVVATAGTVYDNCCADGCGILVSGDEQWGRALQELVSNSPYRHSLVRSAQRRLELQYSVEVLRKQVLCIFDEASRRTGKQVV